MGWLSGRARGGSACIFFETVLFFLVTEVCHCGILYTQVDLSASISISLRGLRPSYFGRIFSILSTPWLFTAVYNRALPFASTI